MPQGFIAQHLYVFYYAGLFVFGAIAGKAVQLVQERWQFNVLDTVQRS